MIILGREASVSKSRGIKEQRIVEDSPGSFQKLWFPRQLHQAESLQSNWANVVSIYHHSAELYEGKSFPQGAHNISMYPPNQHLNESLLCANPYLRYRPLRLTLW